MRPQQTPPPDGRGHHEMGGLPTGPVDRSDHDYAMWEKRVDRAAREPRRPGGTESPDEAAQGALVTRDAMIGVTVAVL